jgi:hypothetical protein
MRAFLRRFRLNYYRPTAPPTGLKKVPKKCMLVPTWSRSVERSLGARDHDVLLADTGGILLQNACLSSKSIPGVGYRSEPVSFPRLCRRPSSKSCYA